MADNDNRRTLRLKVSTPGKTVLEADVDFVLLRTAEGDMGILPGHEPSAVLLNFGVLRATVGKEPAALLAVLGGFATVEDDRVTVLTRLAESPDQIENALAEMERERAENQRREQQLDVEMHKVENALRRALVNMDISSYSIIKGKEEQSD